MLHADPVIHPSVIADPNIRCHAIPCGICVIQSDTGKGSLPSEDFGFPPTRIVTQMFHNRINILIYISEGEADEDWAPFNKTVLMRGESIFMGWGASNGLISS
jgi:hypothetical protein